MSMMFELVVTEGVLKDRRFAVADSGVRLGRASSCEIAIPDPSLSRNHCLFEIRDDALWITDLASANGTSVNGAPLGADSRALGAGDKIQVGDSVLTVQVPGAEKSVSAEGGVLEGVAAKIDLGLGARKNDSSVGKDGGAMRRILLWGVAAVAVLGAGLLVLHEDQPTTTVVEQALSDEVPALKSFTYEKVEADGNGIYRYALAYSDDGTMSVEIDDVPKENRHIRKSVKLKPEAQEHLAQMLSAPELYQLDAEYTGVPLQAGTLKSVSLRVIRGTRVFSVSSENTQEPESLRAVREKLETFSKNEMGIWAIQYSAEKLQEMSAESRRAGDAKWEERDVQHGNLAAALAAYDEAVFYLDTVNPKPADFGALVKRREEVAAELEKRYRDQRFLADRAINLGDWTSALRELRILCDMVPDAKDPRHSEASSKLLDVEARMKKGK